MSHKAKRYLMLLAALGVIAVVAGGSSGTFAGFNAEVSNNNNFFATGTLFLHQQKIGGNLCRSEDNANNQNVTCDVLINTSNAGPGDEAVAQITLQNAGSINATAMSSSVTCTNKKPPLGATSASYTAGTYTSGSPLTLSVSALSQKVIAGTQVLVGSETLTVANTANASATSLDVYGTTAGGSSGVVVSLAAFGNATLCSSIQFYIQETNSSFATPHNCAYPGSPTTPCSFVNTLSQAVSASPIDFTSNLWGGSGNSHALDASGGIRYFEVHAKMPASLAQNEQNSEADFDLTWHIDQ